MKKLIVILAIGLSVAGCATKVNNKPVCKNGVCTLERGNAVSKHARKSKEQAIEKVVEVSSENFDVVVLQATKPVVVDFYATWCGPCKQIKPIYHELARDQSDWLFAAVDVDKAPELAVRCGVQSMPTFVVFKNGVQWGHITGGREKDQFIAELKAIVTAKAPVFAAVQSAQSKELMQRISEKNIDEVEKLIEAGVDVNEATKTPMGDMSALQTAVLSGTPEIIDILLKAGALIDDNFETMTNKWIEMSAGMVENMRAGFTYAQELEQALSEPIKRLDGKLADPDIAQKLMTAMANPEELEKLIQAGADVNAVFVMSGLEVSPLYVAILTNSRQVIEMLINAGATLQTEIIAEPNGLKKPTEQIAKDMFVLQDQGLASGRANLAYVLSKS